MKQMQLNPEIRQLVYDDLSAGCEILDQKLPGHNDTYNKYYHKYSAFYFGCFLDNKLVGLSFGLPLWEIDPVQNEHFLLDSIVIMDEYRNKGYGTKLLNAWEKQVSLNQPIKKIGLATTGEKACRFYDRNGYKPYGYFTFTGKEHFDESVYIRHPFYKRYRMTDDAVIVYLTGAVFNTEEEQSVMTELNVSELVILYEKIFP